MKRLISFLTAVMVVFCLVIPTSMAAPKDKVAEFERHLSQAKIANSDASKAIEKYNRLPAKQKQRLVELMNDPEITKQALAALEKVAPGESVSLSNGEVVVKSEVTSGRATSQVGEVSALASAASEYSWWGSYSWTMTFLGVDLTTLKTKVFYTTDQYNNVIRSDSAVNSHSNIDPLIIVNDGVSSHFKSGDYAYGNGPFTVYGTATFGFVSASVAIIVKAKPNDVTGWKESI